MVRRGVDPSISYRALPVSGSAGPWGPGCCNLGEAALVVQGRVQTAGQRLLPTGCPREHLGCVPARASFLHWKTPRGLGGRLSTLLLPAVTGHPPG